MTTRVLFVDDEPAILTGLRNVLRRHRQHFEMHFADGGDAALKLMRAVDMDVVVSDMRMPGMDGATLLAQVKAEFPRVVRMVLSGHAEREAMCRAQRVAQQYLAKPCDADLLPLVIQRACVVKQQLSDDRLQQALQATVEQLAAPTVYWAITDHMARPDIDLGAVAAVIDTDPALTARFLELAQLTLPAAQPGLALAELVAALGVEVAQSLVLLANALKCDDDTVPERRAALDRFQREALLTAKLARRIGASGSTGLQCFTAALLHDLGGWVMGTSAPATVEAVTRAVAGGMPYLDAERAELGFTHAEAGAYLLSQWELPNPIVEAAAFHHAPAAAPSQFDVVTCVHVADALVEQALGRSSRVDLEWVTKLGLAQKLPDWRAHADALVSAR